MVGYKTLNEEPHVCIYCDSLVGVGEGVLLKYSHSQSDNSITRDHLSNKVGHIFCVETHGVRFERDALIES